MNEATRPLFPEPVVTEVNFKDLRFWIENPRITSWSIPKATENDILLTHEDILHYLIEGDGKRKYNVDKLALTIKNDGKLIDRLVVNKFGTDFLVFEGNRRLAALTLVYNHFIKNENGIVPPQFQKIKCDVYDNLSQTEMYRFATKWHDEGKLGWTPYCTAYSYKYRKDNGETIDELTGGVHQKRNRVIQYIEAIKCMHKYNQHGKENLFSHFLELCIFKEQSDKLAICKANYKDFKWENLEQNTSLAQIVI